jgi:AraC family transcriptional regulator of adaptative response / DNA-3-methyladenine glycosylase II
VGADLAAPVGLPRTRARSISGLAAAVASDPSLLADQGELDDVVARLVALPGIGPWTANYVAMRGLRKDDAFPESDLGLLRAATKPGRERLKPSELLRLAERWRPLRGYAAMHLWLSATG